MTSLLQVGVVGLLAATVSASGSSLAWRPVKVSDEVTLSVGFAGNPVSTRSGRPSARGTAPRECVPSDHAARVRVERSAALLGRTAVLVVLTHRRRWG